jgi:FkbM family methyltransferase
MLKETQLQFSEGKLDKWQYIDAMYQHHQLLFEYAALLPSTNISSIQIEDEIVIMTFRDSGIKFLVETGDKRLAPFDTLNFSTYEQEELQMQFLLIQDGFNVLDIGGNYGWYAMHVAKRFPSANIHSFEPIPFTFNQLKKNIALNDLSNIIVHNIGLSDVAGSFDFYYDPKLSVNASLAKVSESESLEKVVCKVEQLDEFVSQYNLSVDFIKCDVEGAELFAFKGASEILQAQRPIVFTEMLRKWTAKFHYHPNDIIEYFRQFNYQCFVSHDLRLIPFDLIDDATVETNYFFLHREKHESIIQHFRKS